MNRRYMTTKENNKRKQEHRCHRESNLITLSEKFPDIANIKILYTNQHKSIFSSREEKKERDISPDKLADFVIDCLNDECSSSGFDLSDDIYSMRREHKIELTNKIDCEGQEAPDHPEQRCGGTLEYTIKITYK